MCKNLPIHIQGVLDFQDLGGGGEFDKKEGEFRKD